MGARLTKQRDEEGGSSDGCWTAMRGTSSSRSSDPLSARLRQDAAGADGDVGGRIPPGFGLRAEHKSKVERQLVLARSAISEVIMDGPLTGEWLQRLTESERLLRSVEAALGNGRQSLSSTLEATPDERGDSKASGAVSHEVRNWVKGNWTTDGDTADLSGDSSFAARRSSMGTDGSFEPSVGVQRWNNLNPKLASLLARASHFDCDVVAVAEQPEVGNKPITTMFMYALQQQGLIGLLPEECCCLPSTSSTSTASTASPALDLLQERLRLFMNATDETYMDVVYHNNRHAADVMMIMHWFFQSHYMQVRMSPFDHFMSLITAAVHDLGHDGVNNMFHVKSGSSLALRYNDKSVLESMHIATTFQMMREKEELNWFSLLNKAFRTDAEDKAVDLQAYFRKTLIEMVLSTDTVQHDTLMTAFTDYVGKVNAAEDRDSSLDSGSGDVMGRNLSLHDSVKKPEMAKNRQLVLKMLLHAADVSNPLRPQDMMLYFSKRVLKEFWAQGDVERRLGLEVSPLCDRVSGANSVPQGQLGFINFIVKPLFSQVNALLPEVSEAMIQLDSNVKFWAGKKEAGATFVDIFPDDDDEKDKGKSRK